MELYYITITVSLIGAGFYCKVFRVLYIGIGSETEVQSSCTEARRTIACATEAQSEYALLSSKKLRSLVGVNEHPVLPITQGTPTRTRWSPHLELDLQKHSYPGINHQSMDSSSNNSPLHCLRLCGEAALSSKMAAPVGNLPSVDNPPLGKTQGPVGNNPLINIHYLLGNPPHEYPTPCRKSVTCGQLLDKIKALREISPSIISSTFWEAHRLDKIKALWEISPLSISSNLRETHPLNLIKPHEKEPLINI